MYLFKGLISMWLIKFLLVDNNVFNIMKNGCWYCKVIVIVWDNFKVKVSIDI